MRHPHDFRAAVRSGRRAGRPRLVVHLAAPAAESVDVAGPAAAVGFVVSRQVGPAVVRNRVKRRLRHLMLDRLDRLPAGSRAVVRANPAAASASFAELAADLDAALRRLAVGPAR
jgi:ribonuclease P protein component